MNKTKLSIEFGENLESLIAETEHESNVYTDNDNEIHGVMYDLWMDANSKKLAIQMEKEMLTHFEKLYEFSYGVTNYDEDYFLPRETDSITFMITKEKELYQERIKRLWEKYRRFKRIVNAVDPQSKDLLIRYFEYIQKVNYDLLRAALSLYLDDIKKIYNAAERQQEEEADRLEDEYQASLGKERYVIDRKFVYMTQDEYEAHVRTKERKRGSERDQLYKRLGLLG